MPPSRPIHDRFWEKVQQGPGGCLLWMASRTQGGYGYVNYQGRPQGAHRVAWELVNGSIPTGLEPDHLCVTPACVNVDHLELVTGRENKLRGRTLTARNAAVTHCPQGHPYDEANTHVTKLGRRHCRACDRDRKRARRCEKPYTVTDNPADPCSLCVSWDQDSQEPWDGEKAVPLGVDGRPVERLYRGIHQTCDMAAAMYVADHENDADRLGGR